MNDNLLRKAVDARLSGLTFTPQMQADTLRRAHPAGSTRMGRKLSYSLAFAMLGLAGLANKFSDKWGMVPGIILGTFGRFVCAFLSGMIFFGMYAPEGQNLVVYSIVYNGLYLVPEAIICIVLALIPQIRQLAKRLALQD